MPTWLDWFTAALAKYPSPQAYYDDYKAYHAPLYDAVVRACPPPAKLLEVGAGIGWSARALAERGYSVLGLEPDEDVGARGYEVRAGLTELPSAEYGFRRLSLGQATIAELGQFDVVTCLGLVEHYAEAERGVVLGQLALLAPVVVVAIPSPLGLAITPPDMGEQAIGLPELASEVEVAGLTVVEAFGWGTLPDRPGNLSYCVVGRRAAVPSVTDAPLPHSA